MEALTTLPMSELITIFNQRSDKKVKRFTDRKTAERRVAAILAESPEAPMVTKPIAEVLFPVREVEVVASASVPVPPGRSERTEDDVVVIASSRAIPNPEPELPKPENITHESARFIQALRNQLHKFQSDPAYSDTRLSEIASAMKVNERLAIACYDRLFQKNLVTKEHGCYNFTALGRQFLISNKIEPRAGVPANVRILASAAPPAATAVALAPAKPKKEVLPFPKKESAPKVERTPGEKKKQETHPHLNLRCPKCRYYAKTTPDMLAIARLRCPVDGEVLATKEERGETRGR